MLHRNKFVSMVELLVLFYIFCDLFLNLVVRLEKCTSLKYLHHEDKMILSSCFHSLCRV